MSYPVVEETGKHTWLACSTHTSRNTLGLARSFAPSISERVALGQPSGRITPEADASFSLAGLSRPPTVDAVQGRPPLTPQARRAGGSRGAQRPPKPDRRVQTRRGLAYPPLRVPDSLPASALDARRRRESRDGGVSIPYTERPCPSGVNSANRGDVRRVPAPSWSQIDLRQRHLHRLPCGLSTAAA